MIIYRVLKNNITGTADGKPFNIVKTAATVKKIEKLKKANASLEEVMALVDEVHNEEVAGANEYLIYKPATGEYFLKYEKTVSTIPLPKALVHIIETSYDKDIDFLPVVKMWARLLLNPRLKNNPAMINFLNTYLSTTWCDKEQVEKLMEEQKYTREIATHMSTYQDISITEEGLLATYKVADIVTWEYLMEYDKEGKRWKKVKNPKFKQIAPVIDPTTGDVVKEGTFEKPDFAEDYTFTPCIIKNGDKFYSGDKLGYVYEVGKMQYLPEDAERNLENTGGGGGLYSGGLKYIENFRSCGTHILTCFVNPSDILSFQSEGHAFRTDALFPNNVWDENVQLRGVYHSSDYGKVSEARVKALIKKAAKSSSK